MLEFATTLRDAMRAENRTLMDIGKTLGMSHSSVSRWISGVLPDDAALVGQCAACFSGHWPALLVRSYLLDRCPVAFHYLLTEPMVLQESGSIAPRTTLERALDLIRSAAGRNPDMRSLVLDLGRVAEGL